MFGLFTISRTEHETKEAIEDKEAQEKELRKLQRELARLHEEVERERRERESERIQGLCAILTNKFLGGILCT